MLLTTTPDKMSLVGSTERDLWLKAHTPKRVRMPPKNANNLIRLKLKAMAKVAPNAAPEATPRV
jgi:hypothetical protein